MHVEIDDFIQLSIHAAIVMLYFKLSKKSVQFSNVEKLWKQLLEILKKIGSKNFQTNFRKSFLKSINGKKSHFPKGFLKKLPKQFSNEFKWYKITKEIPMKLPKNLKRAVQQEFPTKFM